jgi:deazaflavin-dependent oxidoreductase (nitroreductase family)
MYRLFGRWLGEQPKMMLLTTIGRKSQQPRTVPVVYMPVADGFVVTASNIGLDSQPAWFLNLKQTPQAHVQIGNQKMSVLAEEIAPAERARLWADWVKINPGYQGFQAKTTRQFPMLILKPMNSRLT